MKTVVHHLSGKRAVALGLGSETEHRFPLADVSFVGYPAGTGERGLEAVRKLWDAKCYEPAAILMGEDLDAAFSKTNSVDSYWGDSKEIIVIGERRRSTSVGDVLELLTSGGTSTFHVVAGCGFLPLAAA